jgi:hypothetical protein
MVDYLNRRAKDWQPLLSFRGKTQDEWSQWHKVAFARYIELLGEFPRPVELAPEIIYSIQENGLIRERIVFDSEPRPRAIWQGTRSRQRHHARAAGKHCPTPL